MIAIVTTLLSNPEVQAVAVGGFLWLVNKVLGKRADTKAGKVATALSTSAAIMAQMAMSEPAKTEKEMLVAFKGVVAIQFAKVGFSEAQRAPYQGVIDLAIAEGIKLWVKHHPAPATLTMPVWAKLAMTALK